MIDLRRYRKPRYRPQVFGLSTLDTVTCALAGSIVLLILAAGSTDPSGKLQLVEVRRLFQSGEAEVTTPEATDAVAQAASAPLRNIAVLLFDFDTPTQSAFADANVSGCASDLDVSPARETGRHYDLAGENQDRLAYILSLDAPGAGCRGVEVTFTHDSVEARPGRPSCTMTLIAGGHFQSKRYAPCPLRVNLSTNDDQAFRLRWVR